MKKILILGGTGAIGTHLKDFLVGRQFDVYITSRRMCGKSNGVTYIKGNAHNIDFLKQLHTQSWDCVVDMMVYSFSEFKKLLQTLLLLGKQYIFISSARVFAPSEGCLTESSILLKDWVEDDKFIKSEEYAISKAMSEDLLKDNADHNITIVRPYITYSEDRLQLGTYEKEIWLYRALHNKPIVFPEELLNIKTTLTYGKDVAQGIFNLVCNESAYNEIFNITTNENITWGEVIEIYVDCIFMETGILPKIVFTRKDMSLKTYQSRYDRQINRIFDNSKILTVSPLLSFTPIKDGLASCIHEFVSHPHYLRISPATQGVHDRMTDSFTRLNEFNSNIDKLKYLIARFLPII